MSSKPSFLRLLSSDTVILPFLSSDTVILPFLSSDTMILPFNFSPLDSGGCPAIVKLELLQAHTDSCEFNPFKPVVCEKGCGIVLLRNQVDDHNCLSDLRELVSKQQSQINDLESGQTRQSSEISTLRSQLKRLQDTEVNEHSSNIRKLQAQINRLQVVLDTVQKQQQQQSALVQLHPSSNLLDDDDCDCETCEPSLHRNCLYANIPKKRIHNWKGKDFPASKRPATSGSSSAASGSSSAASGSSAAASGSSSASGSSAAPATGPSSSGGGKPCHAYGSMSSLPDSSHSTSSGTATTPTTSSTSILSLIERSAPSPYSESEILRHNYYHSHGNHSHSNNNCPMSPQDLSTTSNLASSSNSHHQLITFYGQVITVAVTEDDIVEDVKAKIERKESIPIEQQLLFFAGQQLEDDRPLTDYGIIGSETSKHLVLRLRDGMKIMVKTLSDKTIEVQVDPSETIEIVKVKIHEQEGISPCDQRLLQDGRDLADLRTLSDYGIKHGTTLQLDLHLGGPCPICQTQFRNTGTTGSGSVCGDPSSPLPSSSFVGPNSPSTSSTRSSGTSPSHSSFLQSPNTPTSSSGKGSGGKGKGSSYASSPSSTSTAPPAHLNSSVSTATASSSTSNGNGSNSGTFSSPSSHHGQSRGKQ